jgi:putative nucleotidyltransferase with HDIG domain
MKMMESAAEVTSTSTADAALRDRIRSTLTRLSRTGSLPALPAAATAALAISRATNATPRDLSRVLQTDVGLTARMLRVANSPALGRRRRAQTVQEAIVTLGLGPACDILVAISLKRLYVTPGRYTESLWNHSLAVAVAAEELARATHCLTPGSAFLPALFHDIGRIAFLMADPQAFAAIEELVDAGHGQRLELERERYEFDHAQVGAILTEDWGLSARQSDAIRAHHEPERAERSGDLARLLNAADALAYAMGHGTGASPPPDVSVARLDLSPEEEAVCLARAQTAFALQMRVLA